MVTAVEDKRPRRGALDPLADGGRLGVVGQIVAQHRELVTPETSHRVTGTDRAPQPLGDQHQQPVALVMAEAVIDDLELIDIDKHHTHHAQVAGQTSQRQGDPVNKHNPVGQTRQPIMKSPMLQRRLQRLLSGDITSDGRKPNDGLVGVADRRDGV